MLFHEDSQEDNRCAGRHHYLCQTWAASQFERIARRCPLRPRDPHDEKDIRMKKMSAKVCATMAIVLLSGGLALAQGLGGYAPGVNPSNPQDLTNRSNPQSLTVPGGSNPQDLVRSPALPRALSPAPSPGLESTPRLSTSLGHTYVIKPVKKPARTWARRKDHVTGAQSD
jgi:hypothetical protein